ncbi:hypothetical protein KFU94_20825 [Chloroflexi bacterium TSY]|nr:hypothetical protein [Chloroflexi bacterium TSY]MBV7330640.1 hypothetical protein [Chloroflexi bacterium TSY]
MENTIASGTTDLTLEQKQTFYQDGFIVLKNTVPREMTREARCVLNILAGKILMGTAEGPLRKYRAISGQHGAITNLINKTSLSQLLANTMGPFDPPSRGFAAILYPREPSKEIGTHGLPDDEVPNHAFFPHLDGLWTGPIPKTASEVDDWHVPKTLYFGDRSLGVIGVNSSPFFQDPDRTLSIGSFTAFVGIVLNDQPEFGYGNFAVVRGAHHHTAAFFRQQRAAGRVIGPEGHGWPRLRRAGENGVGLTYLPDGISQHFAEGAQYTPDGLMWPEPTPLLVEEGDAFITVHGIPHCGTRNDLGPDPRMNVYFRLRRHRPGGATVIGDSDHPDRGWAGEFLDYPEGCDPWQASKDALCDPWREWDGMQGVVAEARN